VAQRWAWRAAKTSLGDFKIVRQAACEIAKMADDEKRQ
jgi:hypothetical protein